MLRALQSLALAACCLLPAITIASDIYRYHGLAAVHPTHSSDGIYQDFSHDGSNLGKMWSDPDAPLHGSDQVGWLRAEVLRKESLPFMRFEFSRNGYGVNAGIAPYKRIPEIIPPGGELVFEARSSNGACAGIRIMERDGEIWGYGKPGLKYDRVCLPPRSGWKEFRLPLTDAAKWFKFPYGGNVDLGNNTMEADLLAGLSFELGTHHQYYLASGSATLDIRNVRVASGAQTAQLD